MGANGKWQEIGREVERCGHDSVSGRAVVDGRTKAKLFAQAMTLADGNLTRAAHWLGITRLTLREKLAAFGLRPAS